MYFSSQTLQPGNGSDCNQSVRFVAGKVSAPRLGPVGSLTVRYPLHVYFGSSGSSIFWCFSGGFNPELLKPPCSDLKPLWTLFKIDLETCQ